MSTRPSTCLRPSGGQAEGDPSAVGVPDEDHRAASPHRGPARSAAAKSSVAIGVGGAGVAPKPGRSSATAPRLLESTRSKSRWRPAPAVEGQDLERAARRSALRRGCRLRSCSACRLRWSASGTAWDRSNPTEPARAGSGDAPGAGGYGGDMERQPGASDPFARLTAAQHEAVFAERAAPRRLRRRRCGQDQGAHPAGGRAWSTTASIRAHLLVVTFSRKAAQELRRRLWTLEVEGVRAGTFHATALELLEISRAEQGLRPPRLITDRRRALERVAGHAAGRRGARHRRARSTPSCTWAKAERLDPSRLRRASRPSCSAADEDRPWLVGTERSTATRQAKRRQGLLDFDDLITAASEALERSGLRRRHPLAEPPCPDRRVPRRQPCAVRAGRAPA